MCRNKKTISCILYRVHQSVNKSENINTMHGINMNSHICMSMVQTHHFPHSIIRRIQLHFRVCKASFFLPEVGLQSLPPTTYQVANRVSYWSTVTVIRRLFAGSLSLSLWFFTEIFLVLSVTDKVALRTVSITCFPKNGH
jgi:hypothetical protein